MSLVPSRLGHVFRIPLCQWWRWCSYGLGQMEWPRAPWNLPRCDGLAPAQSKALAQLLAHTFPTVGWGRKHSELESEMFWCKIKTGIAHQLLQWAEWAELRESNFILNVWLLIGKQMTSIETLKENTFHPLCQAQAQHRHPCPSLTVAVVGITFCCSLFLTLPLLLPPKSFPGLCWPPTHCSPSWCVTSFVMSLIHSPVTATAWMFSHGSTSGSSGCSRAPQTPPFGPWRVWSGPAQGNPSPLPLSSCSALATKPGNSCQNTWIKNTSRLQAGCWTVPVPGSGVMGKAWALGSQQQMASSRDGSSCWYLLLGTRGAEPSAWGATV